MGDRARGVVIGISGLFAGACAGAASALPAWEKASLVAAVGAAVSTIAWAFLRPRGTT